MGGSRPPAPPPPPPPPKIPKISFPDPPKAPAPPPPPPPRGEAARSVSSAIRARTTELRERQPGRRAGTPRGRRGTILTSAQGVTGGTEATIRTLLGGGI